MSEERSPIVPKTRALRIVPIKQMRDGSISGPFYAPNGPDSACARYFVS